MASRLGYKSVKAWLDDTDDEERLEMLALAWLDGWGEEWQEIAAVVNNMLTGSQEGLRSAEDMRRFKALESGSKPAKAVDWAAVDATFRKAIVGK